MTLDINTHLPYKRVHARIGIFVGFKAMPRNGCHCIQMFKERIKMRFNVIVGTKMGNEKCRRLALSY